jgi:hypothetical protein
MVTSGAPPRNTGGRGFKRRNGTIAAHRDHARTTIQSREETMIKIGNDDTRRASGRIESDTDAAYARATIVLAG